MNIKLARKIFDFAYQHDYWDVMEYCDSVYGEYHHADEPIEGIYADLQKNPEGIASYIEQWDDEEAMQLAREIREAAGSSQETA